MSIDDPARRRARDAVDDDLEAFRGHYRAAVDHVGDVADGDPQAAVRVAVVAAAARAVDARPHDGTARRPGWWPTERPVAVAALLAVSVLVGFIAARAARDDPYAPTPKTIVAAAPSDSSGAASAASAAVSATVSATPSADVPADVPAGAPPTAASRSPVAQPAPPVAEARRAPARKPGSPGSQPQRADAGAPSPGQRARDETPPNRGARVIERPAANAYVAPAAESAAESAADQPTGPPDPRAASGAPPRDAAPAPHGRPGIEPATPDAWVARIVALRAAGRADEAARELAALRRRYPDFAIPAAAAGTDR